MKPRIGVYLSEGTAGRLAVAAKRPGSTKSALVEEALDRLLASDDVTDELSVNRRLGLMSRQLEQLTSDLRIVSETVALQARFHLAVTPPLPAGTLRGACMLGSERFDEFAAQVGRRVHLGTSLMRETMDRLNAKRQDPWQGDFGEGEPRTDPHLHEQEASSVATASESSAAVREGGSLMTFPGRAGNSLH